MLFFINLPSCFVKKYPDITDLNEGDTVCLDQDAMDDATIVSEDPSPSSGTTSSGTSSTHTHPDQPHEIEYDETEQQYTITTHLNHDQLRNNMASTTADGIEKPEEPDATHKTVVDSDRDAMSSEELICTCSTLPRPQHTNFDDDKEEDIETGSSPPSKDPREGQEMQA